MPNIRGKQRERLLAQVDNRCSSCRENNTTLDVHHIKQEAAGGLDEDSNLIVLCPNCHRHFHSFKHQEGVLKSIKSMAIKHSSKISNELNYRYYWFQRQKEAMSFIKKEKGVLENINTCCYHENNIVYKKYLSLMKIMQMLKVSIIFTDVEAFLKSEYSKYFTNKDGFAGLKGQGNTYEPHKGLPNSEQLKELPSSFFHGYSTPISYGSEYVRKLKKLFLKLDVSPETIIGHLHIETQICGGSNNVHLEFLPQNIGMLVLMIDNLLGNTINNISFDRRTISTKQLINYYTVIKNTKNKFTRSKSTLRHLKTGESIAIPLAITWGQAFDIGKEIDSTEKHYEYNISMDEIDTKEEFYIYGSVIENTMMTYTANNSFNNQVFDRFNVENTFSVSEKIRCGSCPYLYGEKDGIDMPISKVLVNIENSPGYSITELTARYDKLWIYENEQELTYVKDDGQFISDKPKTGEYFTLSYGDKLFFKKGVQLIRLQGYYKQLVL